MMSLMMSACSTIASMYDRNDPCQTRAELGRAPGYQAPSWCGASSGRTVIYSTRGEPIGYIRK
jgi:hypothetical protein